MKILALDVGTVDSGYCLMETSPVVPISFGKIANEELMALVKSEDYDLLVLEGFASYGMPVGREVFMSVEWNGRYIQAAEDRKIKHEYIFRAEEKSYICGSPKANDTNIRHALIDRFAKHDFRTGHGTKKNPDYFYGFSNDMWSAFAVGYTYTEKIKEKKGKTR